MVRIGGSHPPDPGSIPGRGRWPPELRWQSGRLLTDRSLVRSQVVASSFFNVLDLRITIKCRVRILGSTNPWRNGSASDSRPEGWGFKSLWVHLFASRAPLAERSAVNRQVPGSIPGGGVIFLLDFFSSKNFISRFRKLFPTRRAPVPRTCQALRKKKSGKKRKFQKKEKSFFIRIEKRGLNLMRSMQQGISTHYNTRFGI